MEATSKGFTHLSTRVHANSNSLERTDITAARKGFVKLCFLTSKIHQTGQAFALPSAQKKRHLPDHPHNFPLFAPQGPSPSSLAQLPPASQRQEPPRQSRSSSANLRNSSSRLLSAGGRRGRALFPFLTLILTLFAEDKKKKSRFKYQVRQSPLPK